jgi:hypothetical protein
MPSDADLQRAWTILFGTPMPRDRSTVDEAALRRAYRRRARETHPDVAGPGASQRFHRVTEAYRTLVDGLAHAPSSPREVRRSSAASPVTGRVDTCKPPGRRLALAQFLFHLGWVSWESALEALRWQEANRIPLGEVAVQTGALTEADLRRVLRQKRPDELIGACALRLGVLTRATLARLLERQKRLQPLVGQYFVQRGLLSAERLRAALARQQGHNDPMSTTARAA